MNITYVRVTYCTICILHMYEFVHENVKKGENDEKTETVSCGSCINIVGCWGSTAAGNG